LDPCDQPTTSTCVVFVEISGESTMIWSERICPIVSLFGKAPLKPVKTFLAKRLAILLTSHGCVSDS